MRLTVEDNPEAIKRYAHLPPAGWKARTCAVRCAGSPRTCTREAGHRGPHACHARFVGVQAVWTDGAGAGGRSTASEADRQLPGRVRRPWAPIGLRNPVPSGVLAGLRNLVSNVASSMEELVWLVFAVAFTVLAIGGFVLINSG